MQGGAANEPRPDVYRHVWQAYGTYVFPVGTAACRPTSASSRRCSATRPTTRRTTRHFSRAYLFNFLPFYHSGLRVTLPVNDKVTLLYMLTNGIQQTEDFNNFK